MTAVDDRTAAPEAPLEPASEPASGPEAVRERWHVTGTVQGVGFRPFVHRLATSLGVGGWVANDTGGAVLEVQAPAPVLDRLRSRLVAEAPRLADVADVAVTAVPTVPGAPATGFTIAPSEPAPGARTDTGAGADTSADPAPALVPPDVAACDACLAEVADPADRRYRYPFGNCTDCGPRFTVVTATPYDRASTTMAGFPLCADCARERADVTDRRFHAEPIACPACGPQLELRPGPASDGEVVRGDAALVEARRLLASGRVVAVKGLGGYHLACDASDAAAVAELRRRKQRPHKPFALLAADLAAVRALARVDDAEAALLTSPARPIVLLRIRTAADPDGGPPAGLPSAGLPSAGLPSAHLPEEVAPGLDEIGVQLPPTPLHALLVAAPGPRALVLTSGNLADEPIAHDDADAAVRLRGLVDAVLLHDRPIHLPCDDSVVRVHGGRTLPLRRSRGYAPAPVRLATPVRPVLAVGGDLKAVACLAAGSQAWPGQHVGDLGSLEGAEALERSARHLATLLRVRPEIVACDAHPGYASTRVARRLAEHWDVPLVRVQHHHAHVASALAEAGVTTAAVGLAFDGTGYGSDGTIWGGEVLLVDPVAGTSRRVGHLAPVPLPGGDAAVRRPARSALAHLHAAGVPWASDLAPVAACDTAELAVVARQLATGFGCVPTSSVGRLFDAVASLCGVRHSTTYEGQAAVELEAHARAVTGEERYRFEVVDGVLGAAPVVRAVVADLRAGVPAARVGADFTASLAAAAAGLAADAARAAGVGTVALSGGAFANLALLDGCTRHLHDAGLHVVQHQHVPAGDGGLSLGQAAVAGARTRSTEEQTCA